jgi:DNA-binding NarL/FixJ family response regulator
MKLSLVIADDHPLMMQGVVGLLATTEHEVVARCLDGEQALEAIRAHAPDVAVLDVHMPQPSGLQLLKLAREEGWRTRIVLLTAGLDSETLVEAVRLGVDGLVLKDAGGDMLLKCLERVAAGEQWIDREAMKQVMAAMNRPEPAFAKAEVTAREKEVTELVGRGLRNKEIARQLGITEGTVKMHLHNLYEKLGISSRTELAVRAKERPFL